MNKWQNKTGRPYTDNRDWKVYNEELVRRGEFLLDFEWISKGWEKDLDEMNYGKRGAPYRFPESLIKLQAVWNQWVDYRGVEGITRKVVAAAQLPSYNDFSTIQRRVTRLKSDFKLPKHGFVSVSTDGTGFQLNNAGIYRQDKHGKKRQRKYIKVTLSANPLTKDLLDCDVALEDDALPEWESARNHMQHQIDNNNVVDKFWGDGLFDVKDLFNFLEQNDIEAAIKIRENASDNADGSMRRAREVFFYKTKGYIDWSRDTQYGKRWLGTEVVFSAVKIKFGEKVRARKTENMLKEAKRKFWAYDTIKEYAKA